MTAIATEATAVTMEEADDSSVWQQQCDAETEFTRHQQQQTLADARNFVQYLAPPGLSAWLDMESLEPLEGDADECNLRVHATRLMKEHEQSMINQGLGLALYREKDLSTLYNVQQVHEALFYEAYAQHYSNAEETRRRLIQQLLPQEPITAEDRRREIITIRYRDSPLHMKILLDNWVYVTYIGNKNDPGRRYKFNLRDMAAKTLQFGIQHSENKFSKNDFRYEDGSHLVFESSVIVETGSTNPVLAAKLLEHTMNILRYVCGYHNVEIRERECHNVVATAILNFGLCPEMLKDRYPFVNYERAKFAGAIVRIKDIDTHVTMTGGHGGAAAKKRRHASGGSSSSSSNTTVFDDEDHFVYHEKRDGHRNDEEVYHRKYNKYGSISGRAQQQHQQQHQQLQQMSDLTEMSCDELAEFEQVRLDAEPILEQHPELGYTVNYDEFDILQLPRVRKEKNVAALIFPLKVGKVICVGNKSREGVIESCYKLFPIMLECRNTPENMRLEKQLIKARQRFSTPDSLLHQQQHQRRGGSKNGHRLVHLVDPRLRPVARRRRRRNGVPARRMSPPLSSSSESGRPVHEDAAVATAAAVTAPEEEPEQPPQQQQQQRKKRRVFVVKREDVQAEDGVAPCRHCDFVRPEADFDAELRSTDDARLCYYCRYCVCNACFDQGYAVDERYRSYREAVLGSDEDVFICLGV